jgi:hypothetical protein
VYASPTMLGNEVAGSMRVIYRSCDSARAMLGVARRCTTAMDADVNFILIGVIAAHVCGERSEHSPQYLEWVW